MAVLEAISSKASLGRAINYIRREEKTRSDLVEYRYCSAESPIEDFQQVKAMWGKEDGREYKHYCLSYAPSDNITPDKAMENCRELFENDPRFENHQIVYSVHLDKDYLHVHAIVNSVNMETGYKLQESKADLQNMKDRVVEQCREQELNIAEKGRHYDGTPMEEMTVTAHGWEYKTLERNPLDSWKFNLATTVQKNMEIAKNREEYEKLMLQSGYEVKWNDTHKTMVYEDIERRELGEKKFSCRDSNLVKTYHLNCERSVLDHEFAENSRRAEEQRQSENFSTIYNKFQRPDTLERTGTHDEPVKHQSERTGISAKPDNERFSNFTKPIDDFKRELSRYSESGIRDFKENVTDKLRDLRKNAERSSEISRKIPELTKRDNRLSEQLDSERKRENKRVKELERKSKHRDRDRSY